MTYTYTYDRSGNIDTVTYSTGEVIRYSYDKLGQLTREDNGLINITYTYTYDKAGNIIKKESYPLTAAGTTPTNPIASAITYVYTQNKNGTVTRSDRLKWVGEHEIEYDTVGNPIEYYNGASYAFTWRGRQLTSAAKNGGTTTYFTYSDEGLRTAKSRGTYEVKYYYSAGLLIGESNNTETILYIYDAEGSPLGMRYRLHTQTSGSWTTYWFEKNLQGDIVAVYNSAGTKIQLEKRKSGCSSPKGVERPLLV